MMLSSEGRSFLLIACLALSLAARDREEAFIGYSEFTSSDGARKKCRDREDHCESRRKGGQCLANPYYMRFNCAQACELPSCVDQGQTSAWHGHASEYHTKQYGTRLVADMQCTISDGLLLMRTSAGHSCQHWHAKVLTAF